MRQRFSLPLISFTLASLLGASFPPLATAGCGCNKPPPPPAAVRPNATYAGSKVTLFHTSLVSGQTYTVAFIAMSGQSSPVSAQAVSRRDLANGQVKPQLIVTVPNIPPGPTRISVRHPGQTLPFLSIPDTDFVVTPAPVVVPSQVGQYRYQSYQAAVGRNGVVYISLDLTGVTLPRTIKAQAKGYALRFTVDDVVFYNTQGFLMQSLDQNVPGLGSVASASGKDSDVLNYARHEFTTFFLLHAERRAHSLDPNDANWHTDGTRHIDHDHLILALAGTLNSGALPTPGVTPAFELVLDTYSLFHHGLVGKTSVELSNAAVTDSYNSQTGLPGVRGDVLSDGLVKLTNNAVVNGNATGASFTITSGAKVNGAKITTTQPTALMPVSVPKALANLGNLILTNGASRTLVGPASYRVGAVALSNTSKLLVNNAAGPVTLYVTGNVKADNGAQITVADPDPEKFAVYVVTGGGVLLANGGTFHGVVYAPQSAITLTSSGQFFGAFVGNVMKVDNGAEVHYDTALRGE